MHSEGQRVALGLLSWVALEGWVGSQSTSCVFMEGNTAVLRTGGTLLGYTYCLTDFFLGVLRGLF